MVCFRRVALLLWMPWVLLPLLWELRVPLLPFKEKIHFVVFVGKDSLPLLMLLRVSQVLLSLFAAFQVLPQFHS